MSDQHLLADLICWEARGEPEPDKVDVLDVVANRLAHPSYPKSIRGIVHQRNQFSGFTKHQGQGDCRRGGSHWQTSLGAVDAWRDRRYGPGHNATHFAVCRLGPNVFGSNYRLVKRGINHCFYRKDIE